MKDILRGFDEITKELDRLKKENEVLKEREEQLTKLNQAYSYMNVLALENAEFRKRLSSIEKLLADLQAKKG